MLNLNVTVEEGNLIIGALSELPAKVTMGLITKLQQQAGPQLAELQAQAEAEAANQAVVEE